MKTINCIIRPIALILIAYISVTTAVANDVTIPDPGLNAAIREALQKPIGPLTEQDLLNLTQLDAHNRNISSVAGLENARNLTTLLLHINHLTNFVLPSTLTNLVVLDLSLNSLTNVFLPGGLTNLFSLVVVGNPLSHFTLPPDLTRLAELDLESNQLTSFNAPSNLTSLVFIGLGFNSLTNFSIPGGLTNLDTLVLSGNLLTNVTLPSDLTRLSSLSLDQNQLTSFELPAGMTNLHALDLFFNQLTNLNLPANLRNLIGLDLDNNRFTSISLPPNLVSLGFLRLRANQLTNFTLPADMKQLLFLDLGENQLRSVNLPAGLNHLATLRISGNTNLTTLTLPVGMTNLSGIFLRSNALTNLTLPPDLFQLASLDILGNQLTSLNLPSGLTNLVGLFLAGNQLTSLTLPPDMTQLVSLVLAEPANPLTNFVLSELLAATTNMASVVDSLRTQGIPVFTYPLTVRLIPRPQQPIGAFRFGITGPPGVYTVFSSTNLADWGLLGATPNPLGSVVFTDVEAHFSSQKFYRTLLQAPPTNMIFISPNTFTMGSPTNEQDRSGAFEGPQSTVTLTRGFWIGQYEVTQGEYVSIMDTNPSDFPGDLSRAVSSVTWMDATNYCWKLTERELAAGRISAGSQYRLPTEAEWECAARAGTATRFSYGDDPDYHSLTNYAWFLEFPILELTVHPTGQKLPNAWGLFDMSGNVWEWCQDWYGDQTGGTRTDPAGPASNPNGNKVMRGGAYDYPNNFCRSASRLFHFNLSPDSDLGFRVVLVSGP